MVIDTSTSMENVREGLGTRLSVLLNEIQDSNWKLAITTTNAHNCLLEEWVIPKPSKEKYTETEERFNNIISSNQDPFCGEICALLQSSTEQETINFRVSSRDMVDWEFSERPILMAINGLGGNTTFNEDKCLSQQFRCALLQNHYNHQKQSNQEANNNGTPLPHPNLPEVFDENTECAPEKNLCLTQKEKWCRGRRQEYPEPIDNNWLQDNSMIAVIIVTDEDNSVITRYHNVYDYQADLNVDELTNYLEGTLNRTKGTNYEIYGILNPEHSESSYKKIIDDNNRQNINDTDYEKVLSNISTGILKVLDKTLDIKDIANKSGFKFKGITGKKEGTHYTRKGSIITFIEGHIPEEGEKITVNFSYTSQ